MQKDYRFLKLKITRGRTMLEMLGTLAIIGVLSLGGLFGYKIAMNQHRANETIHDVMLRASNVPMTWTKYQKFAPDHEFNYPELGVEEGKISTMGYRLNTLKTEEYGYTYKVEAPSVPVEVCRRILRLEPTDIDELRVGSGKDVYSRGAWDLCNQTESDTVEMNFYFEKACVTDENCSACQSCEKGFCRADYDLEGCGSETEITPTPIPPEPSPDCTGFCCGLTGDALYCCKNPGSSDCDCLPISCTGTCLIQIGVKADGCPICGTDECCGLECGSGGTGSDGGGSGGSGGSGDCEFSGDPSSGEPPSLSCVGNCPASYQYGCASCTLVYDPKDDGLDGNCTYVCTIPQGTVGCCEDILRDDGYCIIGTVRDPDCDPYVSCVEEISYPAYRCDDCCGGCCSPHTITEKIYCPTGTITIVEYLQEGPACDCETRACWPETYTSFRAVCSE